ncbi:MAG: hypothetical protein HY588_00725 [Candidatus Omnitrophica bacterium]|nr:hypothetical protein [Candidatus Omnitrophota bacterium]
MTSTDQIQPETVKKELVFSEKIRQMNAQTTLEAEQWFQTNRKVSLWGVFWRTAAAFLGSYVKEGQWRKGFAGFANAVNRSLYQLISYTKYWELNEKKRGRM